MGRTSFIHKLSSRTRQYMGAKPVICITGFAAVGKSTVGKKLAEKLGLKYVSGGDMLKAVAKEMGYKPTGQGWWETKKGLEFLKVRSRDLSLDKKADKRLLKICRAGGVVVDSWVMPWLLRNRSFNVWLTADKKLRAQRMAKRSKIPILKALRLLNRRDRESAAIYWKLYRIKMGEDFDPFHLIVDTGRLNPDQVVEIISTAAYHYFKKRPTRLQPR